MKFWPSFRFGARRRAYAIVRALRTIDTAFALNMVRRLAADLERDLAEVLRSGAFEDVVVELHNAATGKSLSFRIAESGELLDRGGRVVQPLNETGAKPRGRWDARLFVKLCPQVARDEDRQKLSLEWRPAFRGVDRQPIATNRRRLRVVSTGQRGFAFGVSVDSGPALRDVFLHASDAPPGFAFGVGQFVSAEIVQTGSGSQGRRIRRA